MAESDKSPVFKVGDIVKLKDGIEGVRDNDAIIPAKKIEGGKVIGTWKVVNKHFVLVEGVKPYINPDHLELIAPG